MKKVKSINLEKIKEIGEEETIIKEWKLDKELYTDKKNVVEITNNKVVLTDKRLITITRDGDSSFQKNIYKLEDIHSVNTFIGQHKEPMRFQKILASALLLISILLTVLGATANLNTVGTIIVFIVVPITLICAILCLLIKHSQIGVTISIYVTNTKHLEIAECNSSNKVDLSKKNRIRLQFDPSNTAINLALELDNLIIDAQSKLVNK